MTFLQTKPQVKKINNNFYDWFYTVIKNKNDKENVNNKNENIETDYIHSNDFRTPNHYIGIKNDNLMLR